MTDIRFERKRSRAAAYEGDTLAGECDVVMLPSFWIITHTGVGDAFGGQGLAGKLVDCVVSAAKDAGVKIKPFCSYAAKKFAPGEKYADLKDNSVITVYGMPSCPHCAYAHSQTEGSTDFRFVDIGSDVRNMKKFIHLRDTKPEFDGPKANGGIGIPCFVTEEGYVTLVPEEVGLKSKPADTPADGAACRIDGSGC